MRLWFKSCNWFPVGHNVSFLFPGSPRVQFKDMAACHKCRLDWTGKKISTGDTEALLAWLSVHNGLHSQALHERFYMGTPKANWPTEIKLIVSSAWLPAAMAAIWVPNHHRAPHLTKQRALFLILTKKECLSFFIFPFSCSAFSLSNFFPPWLCLWCLRLYNRAGIIVLIPMDFTFN